MEIRSALGYIISNSSFFIPQKMGHLPRGHVCVLVPVLVSVNECGGPLPASDQTGLLLLPVPVASTCAATSELEIRDFFCHFLSFFLDTLMRNRSKFNPSASPFTSGHSITNTNGLQSTYGLLKAILEQFFLVQTGIAKMPNGSMAFTSNTALTI